MATTQKVQKKDVTAQDVADYILAFANETGESVTNLKLQKLVYYAQAWHLANFSRPLFNEEIQAWVHGPVLPSLYHHYKSFGSAPIIAEGLKESDVAKRFDENTLNYLREVVRVYMPFGGYQLELMTHKESPWIDARVGCEPDQQCDQVISLESMGDFYGKKIQDKS